MGLLGEVKPTKPNWKPAPKRKGLLDVDYETARKVAELATLEPGLLGSAVSAGLTVDDLRQGNFGSAALNAIGVLPFIPSMAGVVRDKALEKAAKSHFGATYSPKETGFILDDGTRLDLSGRHYGAGYEKQGGKYVPSRGRPDYLAGSRNVDHRELDDLVQAGGWEGLADFLNRSGAVRYMPDTGISMVDTNMPSTQQIEKAILDFRRTRMPMNVDVDTLSGSSMASQEFEKPTLDEVLAFIRAHMKPSATDGLLAP